MRAYHQFQAEHAEHSAKRSTGSVARNARFACDNPIPSALLGQLSIRRGSPFVSMLVCSLLISSIHLMGCAATRWKGASSNKNVAPALSYTASKQEVVASCNRNLTPSESRQILKSWRSQSVRLHVDGVPIALPASIAVEAPTNFRLLVSNPLSGGHEVDIGSNPERFWIWSKDQPQVMTSSHEDVGLAMDELQMPIHIHPAWLMEVFGVMPLQESDFELKNPRMDSGTVDLVAVNSEGLGDNVERIVRVDLMSGYVKEHLLQQPGGKVIARARLDKSTTLANGIQLPASIKLEWPDARMSMTMEIKNVELNSPTLASNSDLWKMPTHGQVVDIGKMARERSGIARQPAKMKSVVLDEADLHPESAPADRAATIKLSSHGESARGFPAESASKRKVAERPTGMADATESKSDSDLPEWAR